MKKTRIYLLSICLIFGLYACEETKELADVTFNTTLIQSLPVDVNSTSEMTSSIVLDATVDPEINQYAEKIKKYEITELLFAIENYIAPNEDEIYFNGSFGFSDKTENQASSSCPADNLNITHWANTGNFEISTCAGILNEISQKLTNDNAVKLYMTGTFTKEPVSFDLKVTAKVKVTANPL